MEGLQNDVWRCGRGSHPGLQKLRLGKDLHYALDPFVPDNALIIPNRKFGISFADSLEKLRKQLVSGRAWKLSVGKKLPEGLCFNYLDKDHPLLNVSKPMPARELQMRLEELAEIMINTNQKV
ncbi:hypothetical protein ACS6BV_004688 [Vibrio alginolyticus]|uniref:hypothetical protein n=1 Tax=Vibrio TaxID=662 RepID=UPI0006A769D2|nr:MULTISPECIES: hypothetical protein [Vibrio]EGQ8056190.1 hypothetical protein [Vibrio alginolyticus]EIP0123121.1 hypothetical protein [Vibrio alginolyticus]EJI1385115.1 hypothetical protein [Vibrio alginolyticus]EKZ9012669.1 hypothetical protein [Vibrio alginolyticus]ELB2784483.1 hypothetical protein [Vibrio alginolyticus]